MTHATDIVAYTYQAEILCPVCVVERVNGPDRDPWVSAEHILDLRARFLGVDREDEHTYDSDDFPKVVFGSNLEESARCGECGEDL